MSKLEELMDQREANAKRSAAASAAAKEKRRKQKARQDRLYVRKEFNRLFKKLRTLVEGHWDRNGWGWTFKYKGGEYWISYDYWFSAKTPGDVDDYDMSGHHWVLKSHFNASTDDTLNRNAFTLGDSHDEEDFTEKVLDGLKELQNPKGRRW